MKRKSVKQHLNLFEQDKEPVRVPPVRGKRGKKMDYNLCVRAQDAGNRLLFCAAPYRYEV